MPAYKEDNGTWTLIFRYKDEVLDKNIQKKKRGFKTKKDALKYEREFHYKVKGSTDMKIITLYELYLSDISLRIKPKSLETKKYIFEKRILPFFGEIKVTDVSPLKIRNFQNELMAQTNPRTGESYTLAYMQKINTQFKALINYAVRYYGLNSNPFTRVESLNRQVREQKKEITIWSLEEFRKFIEVIKHKPISYTGFNLLFWTGMRVGELLALTREDIDFANKKIHIKKSFTKLVGGEEVIGTTKTQSSERVILIDDNLVKILKKYIGMLYKIKKDERLFSITQYLFRNDITRYHKKAGVKKIRVHDLRHSHASFLINKDVNPLIISKRLGHAKVDITLNTYAHLYPSQEEKIIDIINKSSME